MAKRRRKRLSEAEQRRRALLVDEALRKLGWYPSAWCSSDGKEHIDHTMVSEPMFEQWDPDGNAEMASTHEILEDARELLREQEDERRRG